MAIPTLELPDPCGRVLEDIKWCGANPNIRHRAPDALNTVIREPRKPFRDKVERARHRDPARKRPCLLHCQRASQHQTVRVIMPNTVIEEVQPASKMEVWKDFGPIGTGVRPNTHRIHKTNRPAPLRIEEADPAYLVQMAVYVSVLRQLYPTHRVEAALVWTDGPLGRVTYGDVFHQNEVEQSTYNFEHADVPALFAYFDQCEKESQYLIEQGLALPAYEKVMKASHAFNLLDARHAISVTERQRFILRVRTLSRAVAQAYYDSRKALGFPLAPEALRAELLISSAAEGSVSAIAEEK